MSDGIPDCLLRDKSNRAPFMVGKYKADYSPLSAEEIAAEDPELTALFSRSTPASPSNNLPTKFPWECQP